MNTVYMSRRCTNSTVSEVLIGSVHLIYVILFADKKFVKYSDMVEIVQKFAVDFDEPIIVLVELGTVTKLTKDDLKRLSQVLCIPNIRFVLSRSSGNENFNFMCKTLSSTITDSVKIFFKPFEPTEVDTFLEKICPIQYNDDDKNGYKNLTGGNPYLLSVCVGEKNLYQAGVKVKREVKKYVSDLVDSSLGGTQSRVWITTNLPRSIEFLYSAYSDIPIPEDNLTDYCSSWIEAEGITYIKETTENGFTLALNFPSAYDAFMMVLLECVKSDKLRAINDRSIQGILFEHVICNELKEIQVSYCGYTDVEVKSARFSFRVNVAMSTAVKQLVAGTLYHLRPGHSVLDAVGYLVVDEQPWLLMIQVSLSTYSNHKSKLGNLLDAIDKKEKEYDSNAKNWLQYYRSRMPTAKSDLKFMYIYISPLEFLDFGKPSDTLEYHGTITSQEDVFVGLVVKSSDCANFVTKEYEIIVHL